MSPESAGRADARLRESSPTRTGRFLLLLGTLGAPVAWAFHLFASFGYAPAACAGGPAWGLHAISLASLAVVGASAWIAYRMWRGRLDIQGGHARGVATLGLLGLLLAGLFGALVLLEAWPTWIADPCEGLGAPVGRV